MQQRSEPHDSLDDFPTPPWGTRALVEHVLASGIDEVGADRLDEMTVHEPACNRGYMARPLGEYFKEVIATDIFDYGWAGQQGVSDFLFGPPPRDVEKAVLASNPPFALAEQFIDRGLDSGFAITAMFVRTSFLEGVARYAGIYSTRPPTIVAQFSERVILTKGIVRDPNKTYWDPVSGKWKRPSTATSYCWLVWVRDAARRPMMWIPPCRRQLERPGDYDEVTNV
jgi:hypothetical protein